MSTSSINTPRRPRTYACPTCSRVFSSRMAVVGHQNAHRDGQPAQKLRRVETHPENRLSMTGSRSVNPFSGLSTTNPPGTVVSFLPGLPSATPAPPATAALISFGPVPGYHPISASLAPPPTPLNPLLGGSLQTPAIGSCPRFFEVPDLLGPSVAPTTPDLTDGASSSRPIVLDSDNEDEEENALDLNLKL